MAIRKWFRFHLATLILITLAAGFLMWANFTDRGCPDAGRFISVGPDVQNSVSGYGYGWPLVHREKVLNMVIDQDRQPVKTEVFLDRRAHWKLAANVGVFLLILFVLAWLSELILRRKGYASGSKSRDTGVGLGGSDFSKAVPRRLSESSGP